MSASCPAPHIAHRSGPRTERLRLARDSPIADLQRSSLANELCAHSEGRLLAKQPWLFPRRPGASTREHRLRQW